MACLGKVVLGFRGLGPETPHSLANGGGATDQLCLVAPPPHNTLAVSQPSLPPRCRRLFILPESRVRDSEFTSQLLDLGPGEAASCISKIKPGNIFLF